MSIIIPTSSSYESIRSTKKHCILQLSTCAAINSTLKFKRRKSLRENSAGVLSCFDTRFYTSVESSKLFDIVCHPKQKLNIEKWGTSWTHDVTLIVLFSGSMLLHPLQSVPIVQHLENVLTLSFSFSICRSFSRSLRDCWKKPSKSVQGILHRIDRKSIVFLWRKMSQ